MAKTKAEKVKIQRGFVLGYIALGVVVMTTGLMMSVSSGREILASLSSNQQVISGTKTYGEADQAMEGKDVVVKSGGKLILAGPHSFNGLTIENGGIVSHEALIRADFDENTGALNQAGENKKVDLTISGETKISGEINVSGKGFPAYDSTKIPVDCVSKTDTAKCKKGYGPGGGNNYDTHNEVTYAAGAGHGGKGSPGRYNSLPIPDYVPGGVVYGSDVKPVLPGSAGGSARAHAMSGQNSDGGAGGGVVRLKTGTLTIGGEGAIKANGIAATCKSASCGGGGSGGSVFVEITNKNAQTTALTANAKAGVVPIVAADIAEDGSVNNDGIAVGFGPILQAKGGGVEINGAKSRVAPGAGGRISVVATDEATPTPTTACAASEVHLDLSKVTSSAWTQTWFSIDPNNQQCLTTLQQDYQCSLGWCGGSANTAYQSDWKSSLLYISGYDSSGAPQGYSDYVGFISARKIVVPTTAVYEFSLASDDTVEVYIDSETTPVVTSDKTTVGLGINPNKIQRTLTAGEHTIKLNYKELDGTASLYFSVSKVSSADHSIQLPGGYTAYNIPQSWGVVKIQDASLTGITQFAFNWLGDQQWTRSLTSLYPGIGYYVYTPQAMTLNFDNQPSVSAITPVIKQGWNLLANSTSSAFDIANTNFNVIKSGTTGDCKLATCSESATIASLVSANRAYSNIYLITGPNATTASEAFTILDSKTSGAQIPVNTDFWIYLWQ